jgi:ubiquinone/menaquinone biosynthesis C-methylase UbiE
LFRSVFSFIPSTQLFHKIWSPHYSMGLLFPTEDRLRWMNYPQAQSVYQCFLAHSLRMKETGTYGDFGCGIGGPTRCIAQFSGAKIKAVNINPGHLRLMRRYNEEANIAHRIELIEADYHNTGLPSSSLDGVYMCESAACTFDHKVLCKEVFRVLKPGARFAGEKKHADLEKICFEVVVCCLRNMVIWKKSVFKSSFVVWKFCLLLPFS